MIVVAAGVCSIVLLGLIWAYPSGTFSPRYLVLGRFLSVFLIGLFSAVFPAWADHKRALSSNS